MAIKLITNSKKLFPNESIGEASIEECIDYFKDKLYIQVDTETTQNSVKKDLLPNPIESSLLSLQLGDYDTQFVIDCSTVDITIFKALLEDNNKIKILCNAFFDVRFFLHHGIEINNVNDIFLHEMLLTLGKDLPKGYRSLEGMSRRYLDVQLKKEIRGQIHWRGLDTTVITYASEDVKYMQKILDCQNILLNQYNLQNAARLENKFVIELARMSLNGFRINPEKWMQVYNNNKKLLSAQLDKMTEWIIQNKPEYSVKTLFDTRVDINWNSSKQVIPLMKSLGVDVVPPAKKGLKNGAESVDYDILMKQVSKSEFIPLYIRYKEIEKEMGTYGQEFLEQFLWKDSKIHPEYFQLVSTGRISSSNPNAQNIPATLEGKVHPLRLCFEAGENEVLVITDISQEEPCILADYAKDTNMIEFMNTVGDSHSFVSTLISKYFFGEEIKVSKKNNPVTKSGVRIRDIGKMLSLKLSYGGTAFTLKDDLHTTQEEAQKIIDYLKSRTPDQEKYFKYWIDFVEKNGYIVIDELTNRRCWFDKWEEYNRLKSTPYNDRTKLENSEYYKLKGAMERFAKNFRIQGTGGSILKLAVILLTEEYRKNDIPAVIVNAIHDELVTSCPIEFAEQVKKLQEETMIKAVKYFVKSINIKVESNICKYWEK